ncbi:MAG: protein kinase, partial [Planctomycetota bacterium]
MTGRDQCPDEATLLQVIDGAIEGALGEQLSEHIDDCLRCQNVIERFGSLPGEGLDPSVELQQSVMPNECNTAIKRLIRIARGQTLPRSSDVEKIAGPVPDSMEHFRIQAVIATGGMGTIYRAWDEQLNRVVAIKQLNPLLTKDDQLQRRILNEARTAAKIQHPGVVAVHSVHEDSNPPFFVMEHVDGQSLQTRLSV